jgi:hypothetical protein
MINNLRLIQFKVNRQYFKKPKNNFGFFIKLISIFIDFRLCINTNNKNYLKPTEACQTKASNKNITGIAGIMSTIGRKAEYGSGKADSKKHRLHRHLRIHHHN